jgi:DNA-directed RNA polymerase specialized sigma24 family protein
VTDNEFQAAFDQHKDTVFRFVWRMTNPVSVAEDIAQDVFLSHNLKIDEASVWIDGT